MASLIFSLAAHREFLLGQWLPSDTPRGEFSHWSHRREGLQTTTKVIEK